ncbi:hypothetical protein L9F63_021384 [Diploptera punctata]|uniref:Uncharacterized protein n=1 Tax=Diploptera punctata TaxID=6984 RepID=A0AAD8EC13_DIPPU|nr:hypothetical protein L9F63_021384 [Diploptera punctata]
MKKRRINVTPGKSISAKDLQSSSGINKPPAPESSSKGMKKSSRQKAQPPETSGESDAESVVYAESNDSWNETDSASEVNVIPAFRQEDKKVWVNVVVYEAKNYPGMITKYYKEGPLVNMMDKDEILHQDKEIVCNINAPKKKGKRDIYDVPEMNRLPA